MKYINNLSLAERLGLVPKPQEPRGIAEWSGIEQTFLKRSQVNEPCPICFEGL